ncbi:MAG: hypothetical protein KAY65_01335 [Planctomycetes bacterium]|nr:hypothetical protein [Planctomycetota bacterium]
MFSTIIFECPYEDELIANKRVFIRTRVDLMKTSWLILLLAAGPLLAMPTGRLEICSHHPYYFCDGDRHILLVGVSDRQLFSIWRNDKGFSWQKYLDDLAAHHINYVRQDVFDWGKLLAPQEYPAQLSSPAWLFARTGPGKAIDGKPKFDLTKFNRSYFEKRLKPFLREAVKRGIYVELTLFEGFRARDDFEHSLYAEANNINRLGLRPGSVTCDAALDNPRLLSIQQAYVDKVLAETSEFGNVIYEIANESGGRRWVAHFIDYIHNHATDPSRLVSAGEQSTSFDPRTGANDIVAKHRDKGGLYATDSDVRNHHESLLSFRVSKPVTHNEYFLYANASTDDVNFPRKMIWADFTAGGHSNFFDFAFWRGTGRTLDDGLPSRSPPPEILYGAQYLLDFLSLNKVEFWAMTPHDELAAVEPKSKHYVFTLARPAEQYICYCLGDGPVTIALDLTQGSFTAHWYDPKSGRFITPPKQITGAARSLLQSPPFRQDIVLFVSKTKP